MNPQRRRIHLALAAGLLAGPTRLALAATGPVILSISAPGGVNKSFDMAALERLPQRDIVTETPWYERARKFTGPLLRDVLAAAGASQGSKFKAVALKDYAVEVPMQDVIAHDVVLARLLDGKPMPVRDKGPLFIIYPFSERAELRKPIYFSRCAWQLKAIQVA